MKILYLGNHPQSEYHEISMLLKQGHQVFSLGEQLLPADLPDSRRIYEYDPSETLTELFWELHPNYAPGKLIQLHTEFIQHFELFAFSDYVEHLTLNYKKILQHNKRVLWVWRKRPKSTPVHYRMILNLQGKGVRTIELPTGGRYNVDQCKDIWINALQTM